MGRKMEYFCDACGASFGEKNHLNIKNGKLFVSYYGKQVYYPDGSVSSGDIWGQLEVRLGSNELHFCNVDCMMLYIGNKVRATEDKIKEIKEI